MDKKKIKQMILETRKITAVLCDEGGENQVKIPVFAWILLEDDSIEPLFIDNKYLPNRNPYGIDDLLGITKKNLDLVEYEIE